MLNNILLPKYVYHYILPIPFYNVYTFFDYLNFTP